MERGRNDSRSNGGGGGGGHGGRKRSSAAKGGKAKDGGETPIHAGVEGVPVKGTEGGGRDNGGGRSGKNDGKTGRGKDDNNHRHNKTKNNKHGDSESGGGNGGRSGVDNGGKGGGKYVNNAQGGNGHGGRRRGQVQDARGGQIASPVQLSISSAGVSADVLKFWKQLHKNLSRDSAPFKISSTDDCDMWKQCWAAAASGANGADFPAMSLLQVYVALPDADTIHPPAISVVKVLGVVLLGLKTSVKSVASIKVIDTIVRIIKSRLQTSKSLSTVGNGGQELSSCVQELKTSLTKSVMQLFLLDPDSGPLLLLLNDVRGTTFDVYLQRIASAPIESDNPVLADEPVWTVWRTNPTVGWLMSGEWHQDVPPLKEYYAGGLEEYAETLLRTWTVLTFYWGSAALWPRCREKYRKNGQDGFCDEPLLFHQAHGRLANCRERIMRNGKDAACGQEGVWACHKHSHYQQAVCQRCLGKLQAVRCGAGPSRAGAGPTGASTDIYNAVVLREESRTIGTVFHLAGVTSRKPPHVAPNWYKTYRLQPSALVAVVKLSAVNEPLRAEHVLHWAEIVQSSTPGRGHPLPESRFRQEGKMTIRLLGLGNIATLINEPDLPLNTQVAIIDLQVFVPEVISVLSTFANPRFGDHLSQIPFAKRLIGAEASPALLVLPLQITGRHRIQEYTQAAITNSEIRCLKLLPMEFKKNVLREILDLPPIKNLYGTQLEAFANGLCSALHCTQGPPGTGKSYVGVCIILALVIIRKYVLLNKTPIGPILMLSYKNHALEEFLTDVLKFAPWLKRGDLVRCGKVEHPDLVKYGESNSSEEKEAERALQECIRTQRVARRASKAWLELARSLDFTSPSAEKAVLSVMELLVRLASPFLVDANADQQVIDATAVDEDDLIPSLICADTPRISAVKLYSAIFFDWLDRVRHWKEVVNHRNTAQQQIQLLLTRWLQGEIPPPRCKWDGDNGDDYGCNRYCVTDQSFCCAHLCQIAGCSSPRWDDEGSLAVHCEFHICKAEDCISVRLAAGSFCTDHSCVGCVAQVMAGNVDVEVEMVLQACSGCSKHSCHNDDCLRVKLSPHIYCVDHICIFCAGYQQPVDALPSTNPGGFCVNHGCVVQGCSKQRLLSIDDAEYCAYHTCRLCTDAVDLSSAETALSMLCADHRCAYPEYTCQQEVLETNDVLTERCEFHTCRVCVTDPSAVWGTIVEDFPRNVCEAHPLCTWPLGPEDANVVLCNECAVPGTNLCAEHIVENEKTEENEGAKDIEMISTGMCHGTTSKGANCKAKCPQHLQLYCAAHINQAPVAVPRQLPITVDRRQLMQTQHKAKVKAYMDNLQQQEETVKRGNFVSKIIRCVHEGCVVHALTPLANVNQWCCALHKVVQLPQAPVCAEVQQDGGEDRDRNTTATLNEIPTVLPSPNTSCGKGPSVPSLTTQSPPPSDEGDYDIMLTDEHYYSRADELGGRQLDPDEMEVYDFDADGYDPTRPVSGVKSGAVENKGTNDVFGNEGLKYDTCDGEDAYEEGGDSDDENDHQRRLQEIGAIDDEAAEEAEESDSIDDPTIDVDADIDDLDDDEVTSRAMEEAESWNWRWSVSQRHDAVSRLVRLMVKRLTSLRTRYEAVVAEARMTKSEAGAATLKKAVIVGATVVGASMRLEKFRAAEPFAAVVEEACEVMEPTLISVLAVKSLQKLELVGDHRQLPAFVQQCWYNLQTTMSSIKTSMFERLIGDVRWKKTGRQAQGAPNAEVHRVPFSVLDEQRRMRRNLADLTRPHYSDVTKITDHPKTASQQLGDTLVLRAPSSKECQKQLNALQLHRQSWSSLSLDTIPGVTSNVFFWDLPNNAEGRPQGGLSACNESEARSVVQISKFLVLCGTPPSSITIITPYKGQKNLIIKLLRAEKLLPERSFNNPGHHEDSAPITVSTVDTFQGDENDIILLSIVRCKPGNQFIELQNRFIVAMSRARLALFVVGCKDAVMEGYNRNSKAPSHWTDFVKHLESGANASSSAVSCIGAGFPVCCPRHTNSVRSVESSESFPTDANWGSFCRQVCTTKLPCTHKCGMLCHSPSLQPHTPQCFHPVPRPCEKHPEVVLLCKDIQRSSPDEPQQQALRRFSCEVRVSHRRSCGHVINVTCDEQTKLISGMLRLKDCEQIVEDFPLPCDHIIVKPTCASRTRYQTDGPPPCNVNVPHIRQNCKCRFFMTCHDSVAELRNDKVVVCGHTKEIRRPRCGHALSNICHIVAPLATKWNQSNSGERVQHAPVATQRLVVPYSSRYGCSERDLEPKLPECNVKVNYLARCGHSFPDVLCCQAFNFARTGEQSLQLCSSDKAINCLLCDAPGINVPCWSEVVSRNAANSLSRLQTLTRDQNDQYHTVNEDEIELFSLQADISNQVINVWKNLCKSKIRVLRNCGHVLDLNCHDVFELLSRKRRPGECLIAPCIEMVDRILYCKHTTRVKCCDERKPEPKCTQQNTTLFTFPCGEHTVTPKSCAELRAMEDVKGRGEMNCKTKVTVPLYRCGHLVHVECHQSEDVQREAIGKWLDSSRVVLFDQHYCAPCTVPEAKCAEGVTVLFPCGHRRENVPCDEAFAWVADDFVTAPHCCERVTIDHPVCGHALEIMCWIAKELQVWNAWPTGVPEVIAQQVLDPTGRAVLQNIVASGIAKPAALPAGITAQMLRCTHHTTYLRETCDHTHIVPCSDAFWHNVAPCSDPIDRLCADCQHRRVIMCHQKDHHAPCQNKVPKLCSTCKVNDVTIECCKSDIQCARQVKADLWCRHEATWLCGKELDPRTRGVKAVDFCLACVAPNWRDYIDAVIPACAPLPNEDCWLPLMDQVETKMDPFVTVLKSRALMCEPQLHVDARERIARSVLDALQTRVVELPPSEVFLSADELMSSAYTWVLCRAQGTDQATMETFRTPTATKFGQGVELEILTEAALQDLFRAKAGADGDESVNVCVGVVYSRKYLPTSDPFVASNSNKEKANAQRVVLSHRTTDLYDAVEYTPRAAANTAAGRKYLITWEAGAAVPLAVLTVQKKFKCITCWDMKSAAECFVCPSKCGTCTCWECLSDNYDNVLQEGAILGQIKDGELLCSKIDCKHPITVFDLSENSAPSEVLRKQAQFKINTTVEKVVKVEVQAKEKEIRDEYARIEQIKNQDEKAAAALLLKIVNEVFLLKCPRCKYPFVDFDGCFAVTCGCGCGFCAWCLKDCGHDAHEHVPRCPEGDGGVYSTPEAFERHHNKKKNIAARELIQASDLNNNARAKLAEMLRQDLPRGITLNEIFPEGVPAAVAVPVAAGGAGQNGPPALEPGHIANPYNQYDDYLFDD